MTSFNAYIEDPLFFRANSLSKDTSTTYSLPLPAGWHEIKSDKEWTTLFPLRKKIQRQGWKVHVSASLADVEAILKNTAEVCFQNNVCFKHLATEKVFKIRNGKHVSRGFSGKFITCYPDQAQLEMFLDALENKLAGFSGPYILSDKRWQKAPIYLRYGVFRDSYPDENMPTDSQMLKTRYGEVADQREAMFNLPEGIEVPMFLESWLHDAGTEETMPFMINSAIQFSNCGGIYHAILADSEKEIILKEARPYTGIDHYGVYATDRLASEKKALEILSSLRGVPDYCWYGTVWEHQYLAMEKVEGVALNRWVTGHYPFSMNKQIDYLQKIQKIVRQLIEIVEASHNRGVYHQDIHLRNIILTVDEQAVLIDWGEALFINQPLPFHQVAAPGFRAWGKELTPEQIDWYGVLQVAHFLFFPLILQAELVYQFGEQTMRAAQKYFRNLGYKSEEITAYVKLLSELKKKVKTIEVICPNKVLRPYLSGNSQLSADSTLQTWGKQLLNGAYSVMQMWQRDYDFRHFPVHYYGTRSKLGIAFSDLGIIWAYTKLEHLLGEQGRLTETKQKIIAESINDISMLKQVQGGLFDGLAGTCWLLDQLGETEQATKLVNQFFKPMIEGCKNFNLYNGLAGILLTGSYFFSQQKLTEENAQLLISKLRQFAHAYQAQPSHFCRSEQKGRLTNNPVEQTIGLFYGHAGLGWLFSEAYRLTNDSLFIDCLNVAIEKELASYVVSQENSLQCKQQHRSLPYLATGSAGLGLLIAKNSEHITQANLSKQLPLYRALETNFSVFPGLFNGYSGLKLSQLLINRQLKLGDAEQISESFVAGLQPHLIQIGTGLAIAGDHGTKLTMDIFSGFAGVALTITNIMDQTFDILPALKK
ncbi:class III lanthionine synthetase LanKC [Candidatus Enterococcus ikei]|uniref:Class III lanthionine synthetase LanKC n=1 Tax=Candidatus Enterococcus ikei TaxID=2815326 RepID=A0ABS3GY69_9ENTE|nr:class III lanthionine synthetase LanKC [Enterococcus sp. DIV0869a]MBO0439701.1 class III lanthionine synthetase LanKC [Enterococcus sp. DIV0869a]